MGICEPIQGLPTDGRKIQLRHLCDGKHSGPFFVPSAYACALTPVPHWPIFSLQNLPQRLAEQLKPISRRSPMLDKTATVHWKDSGKEGVGQVSTEPETLQTP